MNEYTPNKIIVLRVCQIWSDALQSPKYDNGDTSGTGFLSQVLVANIPSNATPELLFQFRKSLAAMLMVKWQYRDKTFVQDDSGFYISSLHTDYHPDHLLQKAADEVGLKMEFPWKCSMNFCKEFISWGYGYRSPREYHYPLNDEGTKWLVTSLEGQPDIEKVKASVLGDNPLGLRVDE